MSIVENSCLVCHHGWRDKATFVECPNCGVKEKDKKGVSHIRRFYNEDHNPWLYDSLDIQEAELESRPPE